MCCFPDINISFPFLTQQQTIHVKYDMGNWMICSHNSKLNVIRSDNLNRKLMSLYTSQGFKYRPVIWIYSVSTWLQLNLYESTIGPIIIVKVKAISGIISPKKPYVMRLYCFHFVAFTHISCMRVIAYIYIG